MSVSNNGIILNPEPLRPKINDDVIIDLGEELGKTQGTWENSQEAMQNNYSNVLFPGSFSNSEERVSLLSDVDSGNFIDIELSDGETVIDMTPAAPEEGILKKAWNHTGLGLRIIDTGFDIANASAKMLGQDNVAGVVDYIQSGTHIAMGAKAAEEGKFAFDPNIVIDGTPDEKCGFAKSGAFFATCLSTTVQVGSAIASATGGEELVAIASACNNYIVPGLNKGFKDPSLLYAYYHGYQKTVDKPTDTEEEKYAKRVERGKYVAKGAVKAAKLATNAITLAAPALGLASAVTVPLAVVSLGVAGADAYLNYRDVKKQL